MFKWRQRCECRYLDCNMQDMHDRPVRWWRTCLHHNYPSLMITCINRLPNYLLWRRMECLICLIPFQLLFLRPVRLLLPNTLNFFRSLSSCEDRAGWRMLRWFHWIFVAPHFHITFLKAGWTSNEVYYIFFEQKKFWGAPGITPRTFSVWEYSYVST